MARLKFLQFCKRALNQIKKKKWRSFFQNSKSPAGNEVGHSDIFLPAPLWQPLQHSFFALLPPLFFLVYHLAHNEAACCAK